MQIINLYKYIRENGGTTVSPIKPECDYTEMYRLIADESKVLVKDDIMTSCIDTDTPEGWEEIDEEKETINNEALTNIPDTENLSI